MDDQPTAKIPPLTPGTRAAEQTLEEKPAPLNTDDMPTQTFRPVRKARRSRRRLLSTVLFVLAALSLLTSGGLAFGSYYYQSYVQKPLKSFIRPVGRSTKEPALNTTPSYDVIKGRTWNILLLGSDNDGKYNFPALLTQVMMVVHVDPDNNSVTMLSIPRDSWVNIPNIGGMHKIDQAFLLGVNQDGKFESGVQQARLTIENDYGITVDRYAWVGLSGFAKVIDTLGGVDIDVTHPIVDDLYPNDTGQGASRNDPYSLKRLYLAPGPQHLTGEQALEYVRTRHADLVGDIGRTQRQQQVLEALKRKLTITSVISNLPTLLQDLTGQVYTDLNEQEMLAFANFGRTLPSSSIQRITLGPGPGNQDYGDYSSVYDSMEGSNQDVIIPHCENIQPVVNHIFGLGNAQSCNVNG